MGITTQDYLLSIWDADPPIEIPINKNAIQNNWIENLQPKPEEVSLIDVDLSPKAQKNSIDPE